MLYVFFFLFLALVLCSGSLVVWNVGEGSSEGRLVDEFSSNIIYCNSCFAFSDVFWRW